MFFSAKILKSAARKARGVRSGLTLIELVVAIAISTIVMGAVASIFMLTYQSYENNQNQAQAQNLAVLTLQKIKDTVRSAKTVTIYSDKADIPDSGSPIYFDRTDSGIKIGTGSYLKGTFKDYGCDLTFKKSSANLLDIAITIYKMRGSNKYKVFNTNASVYLLNATLDGSTTGSAITFTPLEP